MVDVGDAQRQAGDPGFRDTLLAAGRCAQELGETETFIAAALATSRGVFSTTGLVDDETFALIEAAAEAAGTSDTKHRGRLLSLLALERVTSANYLARRRLVDEAVAICRRLDDPATLLDVLVRSFDAIRVPDSLADRLSMTAEAEQLALSLNDRVGRFWTVFQRTYAATESGDVTEAQRCRRETVALASQLGQPIMRWLATMNETWFTLLGGDADQAEALANETLQLGSASGQPDATVLYTFQLHIIRWHQGRGADVIDVLEGLADDVPLPLFRAAKARVYYDIGRHAEARALLAVEADASFAHLLDWSWLALMSNWAEVAAGLGDRTAVDVLHEQLLPWSTQVICTRTHVAGAVAHYLGMLDAARHDYLSAEMHFDRALTVHRSLRAPFHVARTHPRVGANAAPPSPPGLYGRRSPTSRVRPKDRRRSRLRARAHHGRGDLARGRLDWTRRIVATTLTKGGTTTRATASAGDRRPRTASSRRS